MGKSLFNRLFSGKKARARRNQGDDHAVPSEPSQSFPKNQSTEDIEPIIIVGAGIVGLVLALALEKQCGIKVDLYEQAAAFHDDVGAGMGFYPNGLRVIQDISEDILEDIQSVGYPYLLRRYERHDGTEVATADERKLTRSDGHDHLDDLQPIGVRRWKLQKILYEAVLAAGIKVHFRKRLEHLEELPDQTVSIRFSDGIERRTCLLIGVDGSKSQVRTLVTQGKHQLKYIGTTCLMGISNVGRLERGLCLPSSDTTKCHGAFYPTGKNEQCFQFHFPASVHQETQHDALRVDPKTFSWGGLTHIVSQEECSRLADQLKDEGWDDKYIQPLRNVSKALRIGFSTLDPPLETFVFGRTVLVSDACHPPTPYLGQGAQMGLEDAGTLALLLKEFCARSSDKAAFSEISNGRTPVQPTMDFTEVDKALALYDRIRRPRTTEILGNSKLWGLQQQKRAANQRYSQMREETIKREIFYHETLPMLLPAVRHDYVEDVKKVILDLAAQERAVKASEMLLHPAIRSQNYHPLIEKQMAPVPEETECY